MHAKHADGIRLNEPSGRVIGSMSTVFNRLGAGFLEKVYENALALGTACLWPRGCAATRRQCEFIMTRWSAVLAVIASEAKQSPSMEMAASLRSSQ
jgi:hypothetical protein